MSGCTFTITAPATARCQKTGFPDWQAIESVDTTPPTITCRATNDALWPPNHKLRLVSVDISTSDDSGPVTVTLVSVTSSDPDGGQNSGRRLGDIKGWTTGTDDRSVSASGAVAAFPDVRAFVPGGRPDGEHCRLPSDGLRARVDACHLPALARLVGEMCSERPLRVMGHAATRWRTYT